MSPLTLRDTASVVLDTDAASFLVKHDRERAPRYLKVIDGRPVVLPSSVVAELLFGAKVRNWGPTRMRVLGCLFAQNHIAYPDFETCELWADLRAAARGAGREIQVQDAWVAATALRLGVPLVTHNARHYVAVPGLRVETSPDP
jgi:predicted nucleic acid-binding protein